MTSFNRVILMGRLTRDVELRTTSGGHSVTDITVAVNERCQAANGDWVEQVHFIDVTFWNRKAEVIAQYFSKGSPILVEGRLHLDRWEKEDKKFSKLKVRGEHFSFVGSKSDRNGSIASATDEEAIIAAGVKDEIPF